MLFRSTKHPARFVLRNVGPVPLTIARAQPSCKCTDISPIVGKTIPPGGTLELAAALQVPKSPGDKDAKVMISVEGMDGLVLAKMVADVTQPVRSEPAYVDALRGATEVTVATDWMYRHVFFARGGRRSQVVPLGADLRHFGRARHQFLGLGEVGGHGQTAGKLRLERLQSFLAPGDERHPCPGGMKDPSEAVTETGGCSGDDRHLSIETEQGILLSPFDPAVQEALALATEAARQFQPALRELAH